jgi:hypothetical protein
MWNWSRVVILVAGIAICPAFSASAAPPQSCAYKYIGKWVYPGGTTVVAPGGKAYPDCPFCPTQTWTCNGNTYYFDGVTATLSPDGRKLYSPGIVATRVGGPGQGGDNSSGQPPKPAKSKDDEPTVTNPLSCISVSKAGTVKSDYKVGNRCKANIFYVLSEPSSGGGKQLSWGYLSKAPTSTNLVVSYLGAPSVVWACAQGAAGCSEAAARARAGK